MLHTFSSNTTRRVYNIKPCTVNEMLSDLVHTKTWTLCTGWRVGDTLYLNDATSENGAQEYAVLRVQPGVDCLVVEQFESVTFSWMTLEEIEETINQTWNANIETGNYAELRKWFGNTIFVQDHHDALTYCPFCA